ncbi:C-Myc binding protein, putative [Eimeria necatrix]|uniref:c-Myc binding protein, putative n=1 Tax=Eimeria necatrix TaxID=51315 RepID=U6MZA5_9EIME|nr:C-Myc binding protein, putative [Eimeria necatrix]CDJ68393.1 C-Myc binding protein, putative [Eimeria necatrix]
MNAKQDPTDGNKAAFRKYLEDHGVIRQLTRVLVGLYETSERPLNALDYIKRHLGAPTGVEVDALRAEVQNLTKENAALKAKVESLQQEVALLQRELAD